MDGNHLCARRSHGAALPSWILLIKMIELGFLFQVHEARFVDNDCSSGKSPSQPTHNLDTDQGDNFPVKTCPTSELVQPLLSASSQAGSRKAAPNGGQDEVGRALLPGERTELLQMSDLTARGIHDAGWQRFGYWFATPEAWDQNGTLYAHSNSFLKCIIINIPLCGVFGTSILCI